MEFPSEIVAEAARRWQDRQPKREQQREALRRGQITEAETPERIARRLTRLSAASSRARSRVQGRAVPTLVETIGLERVLGKADFLGMQFVELALAVARFVGRVHIRQRSGRTAGFGTGFMVSPRLLLTNNHVLPSADFVTHSEIEFDYQYDRRGHLLPVIVFGLEPEAFFLTDQALDYTLVAVRPTSLTGTDLQLYGWSRLDPTEGKALLGDALNVIQHPKGEAKQIVLRSNQLVDLFDHFAHYVTDTEPGSSGAPVYNDEWEVVALHHSGVPRTDAAGNYLAKDGTIWRPGMDTDQIAWAANEGIRVSSLVDHVKRQPMPNDSWRAVRTQLLELQPPDPLEAAAIAASPATGPRVSGASTPVTSHALASPALDITVPIQISVRVGDMQSGQLRVEAGVTGATPGGTGGRKPSESAELAEARARLDRARRATYYDGSEDARARQAYYREIVVEGQTPEQLYRALSALVQHTHTTTFSYADARQQHLYPVVDLHPDGKLRSLYTRDEYEPVAILTEDFAITEALLAEALGRFGASPGREAFVHAQLELLEAAAAYNAEHVVPQSWFGQRSPMRSDLHHIFTCENVCNSFRGNTPYAEFADFGEADRIGCGRRVENRFEPAFGHGPAARATMYFLLRYPGEVNANAKEYTRDRLDDLLEWHRRDPVTDYERHRNAEIHRGQGNRNPLIDYPEWADRIDFSLGLGGA